MLPTDTFLPHSLATRIENCILQKFVCKLLSRKKNCIYFFSDTLSYFIQIAVCSHMVEEDLNNKADIITC